MVLHITNDFAGSSVYKNLVSALDNLGTAQIVYTPVRDAKKIGLNHVNLEHPNSQIVYSDILDKTLDRVLYRRKIEKIFRDLESKIILPHVEIIHAHTWFSDGGVAYQAKMKYGIPYILAIRSSDMAFFYRFLFWQRNFAEKILKNAEKIIFISPSYRSNFEYIYRQRFLNKSLLIPNGIDPYWIENSKLDEKLDIDKKVNTEIFKILYVGQFIRRKNLVKLIEAVKLLNEEGILTQLNVVGDHARFPHIRRYEKKFTFLTLLGKITDKKRLQQVYQENFIFALPSVNETFGLVYIEALSQNLPILFTKDDGVDGLYEGVGEAVNKPVTVQNIFENLKKMIRRVNEYNIDRETIIENHDWNTIALKYREIYEQNSTLVK